MSNAAAAPPTDPALPTDVPYEALPTLVTDARAKFVFVELMRLKQLKDRYFEKRTGENRKKLPSLWDDLKTEAGALVAAAGARSISYSGLRILNAEGGSVRGKVTGSGILDAASGALTLDQLRAVALAARDCDPDVLARGGIPAHLIAAGREPDERRAASTRVEWIKPQQALEEKEHEYRCESCPSPSITKSVP